MDNMNSNLNIECFQYKYLFHQTQFQGKYRRLRRQTIFM